MTQKKIAHIFFALCIGIILAGCSTSIPVSPYAAAPETDRYSQLRQEISASIQKGMRKHKVTGMSVALVDDGKVVWAQGFGYADNVNGRLADANTLYRAGSISKLFTATAIMQLVEQGKVDLDAPIQKYIPELKPKYHFKVDKPITLRHIMSHRSGLPGDMVPGMFTRHPERFDNEIAYINSVHSPYAPGEVFAYSNIATDLQGIVVERVSGMKFEDYVQQHILKPLGMNESTFVASAANPKLMSKGYSKHEEQELFKIRNIPAGALRTNVLELSKFASMVLEHGKPVLQSRTLQQMFVRQRFDNELYDESFALGLNWFLTLPKLPQDTKVVWHGGDTIYHHSTMVVLPEEGLAVIVLTNSDSAIPLLYDTTDKMVKAAIKAKSGRELTSAELETSPQKVFTIEELQQLPGHYGTQAGEINITRSGDSLRATLAGLRFQLHQHEDGWMTIHAKLLGFIPINIPQLSQIRLKVVSHGDEQLLLVNQGGMVSVIGNKVTPYAGDMTQWQRLEGTWMAKISEEDYQFVTEVKVRVNNGFVYIIPKVHGPSPVPKMIAIPVADDMLVFQGIGRSMRETAYLRHEDGKPVIEYQGIRFYRQD